MKNCICCLCSLLVLCKSVHALDCIYNIQCTLYIFCSFTVHCAVSLYSVQWYCTLHSMIILAVGLFVRIKLHRWCEIFQTFKEHTTAKHRNATALIIHHSSLNLNNWYLHLKSTNHLCHPWRRKTAKNVIIVSSMSKYNKQC